MRQMTMLMFIGGMALVVALLFGVASLAFAQPELEVGQEVELFLSEKKYAPSHGFTVKGRVVELYESFAMGYVALLPLDTEDREGWTGYPMANLTGYRILKPAPRPEFSYPAPTAEQCREGGGMCVYTGSVHRLNYDAIADELRYLRKEIERLHK